MRGQPVKTSILSIQIIPNGAPSLLKSLGAGREEHSLAIITTDCDDVSYAALDEATKKARVRVLYAESMYAGSRNASTSLAGEFIGILAAEDPEEVKSGAAAAAAYIKESACFYSANEDDSILYFAHCIPRTGSWLSRQAKVKEGTAMAYLIAPPQEAICGLDAALKAAQVEMKVFYGPPTNTNFAGGLLTGDESACRAACQAFAERVCQVAEYPIGAGRF